MLPRLTVPEPFQNRKPPGDGAVSGVRSNGHAALAVRR
jgi:hypothetical protein